jgi:hypothetical protein
MAEVLTTAKELISYYEFFKIHDKFDYKSFIYDISDLFQDFLSYFPKILQKIKHNSIETEERTTKKNQGIVLGLISNIFRKRPVSSFPKMRRKSLDSLNFSHSSLFKTFLNNGELKEKSPKHETKSTIIHLKSRKITLNETEINKALQGYKRMEKNKHFRILPENINNEELSLERSSLHFEKNDNNENYLDNELFESIFKSKTVFHKQFSSHLSNTIEEFNQKEIILPKILTNKQLIEERKKERKDRAIQSQIMMPIKADNLKYMKQIPDMKSFKNLQMMSKDYLNRFIIKK